MERTKIRTSINLEGMNELEKLLQKQEELLRKLRRINEEIEKVKININLSIEKATSLEKDKEVKKISNILTEDLIAELSSRNLFEELSQEKQEWLRNERYLQISRFQFGSTDKNKNLYSLKYLKETRFDTIILGAKRQSTGIDRLSEI